MRLYVIVNELLIILKLTEFVNLAIILISSIFSALWHKAKKVNLQTGQTEVKIEFPLPIVACNLMIEYADFYENIQASSETLQCPRCSASVPANPGVCSNCGENVFQCHKCRSVSCLLLTDNEILHEFFFIFPGPSITTKKILSCVTLAVFVNTPSSISHSLHGLVVQLNRLKMTRIVKRPFPTLIRYLRKPIAFTNN